MPSVTAHRGAGADPDSATEEGAASAAAESLGTSVERLHATVKTMRATRTKRIINSSSWNRQYAHSFSLESGEYTAVRPVLGRVRRFTETHPLQDGRCDCKLSPKGLSCGTRTLLRRRPCPGNILIAVTSPAPITARWRFQARKKGSSTWRFSTRPRSTATKTRLSSVSRFAPCSRTNPRPERQESDFQVR